MTRPDIVVVCGRAAIVVSGDRAHDLLTGCGVAMAPTFAGWRAPLDDLPLVDGNCGDLEVRFEGPGVVGFGDVRGAGDEVRVVGVLAPGPGLELAERLWCSTSGREGALDGERHGVVFGVIDPAVAASGDDQGVLTVADERLGAICLPWRLGNRRHCCPDEGDC
jgi:hypothetical protein